MLIFNVLQMKILSNEQLNNVYKYTIEHDDVTSLDLIENSAEAITAEIIARWPRSTQLLVFAGWGNNGADALLTSLMLIEQGYRPEVFLFNINNRITPECSICRDRLLAAGNQALNFHEVTGRETFVCPEPSPTTLIIDGLFGSGLDKPLPVSFRMLVQNINQSGAQVVSIDIPSGLFSDWNKNNSLQNVVHATLTLALGAPRLSFMIEDYAEAVGEWKVLDIGLSQDAIRQSPYTSYLVQNSTIRQFLPLRNPFCTKQDFGNVLIVGGKPGMFGAPCLSAQAALRSGAGRVTVHSASSGMPVVQSVVPCAMFNADKSTKQVTEIPTDNFYDAIAIGMGLGTDDTTIDALEYTLKSMDAAGRPVILDADALNCLAKRPLLLNYLPVLSVLTPHAAEFDRIFGKQKSHEERLRKALDIAQYHRIIIVLKGHYTAIVRPDGKIFFNSSGTPALATPGSGDVLTGIIASFMAQGYKPEKATFIATYIHGVAGHLAEISEGQYGTTAIEIAANTGKAIKNIQES